MQKLKKGIAKTNRYIRIEGNWFKIDENDSLGLFGGEFEKDERKCFKEIISKDDIVADVGANIGYQTVLFALLSKKVYAFEPNGEALELLQKNLEMNNVNADIVPFAVSDINGSLNLNYFQSGSAYSSILPKDVMGNESSKSETVKSITLDDFFHDKLKPTFIKIDIEGLEKKALEGAKEILKTKPVLFIEINPEFTNVMEMVKWIEGFGYSSKKISRINYLFQPV
ncbi:MAG: FkbM family methyltransferase [Ignavibacteriae bacterium]|nr:FkbM family methyltransferase [Ignavibacteriota bacterium]